MPPPRPDAVLKVGGSLGRRPGPLRRLMAALGALAGPFTLVVVPGGGAFADQIRRADRVFGLGDSSAHWMAILAMDQSAHLLRELAPGGLLVRAPTEIRAGRLNVLAPSAWLIGADPLPHSWDVTSDSIAAWVARALRARRLVLLKAVDGVFGARPARGAPGRLRSRVTADRLGRLVDGHFRRALEPGMPCWIVSGARPERVRALLASGSTYGTEVIARGTRRRRGAPRRGRRPDRG